ncbi:MAG: lysophospholipid acyltransferase family protein [Verrucomicrobia bacterium]|nr:lysophospholipid acyltransferase family protein [Verrucomicrobiota bacterium]
MPASGVPVHELRRTTKLLVWGASLLIKLLCATLRYRVIDEAGFLNGPYPTPVVILIWHNRILVMPSVSLRYYPKRKGVVVLTSPSRDGAYLAEFIKNFRLDAVRGSSSRRGAAALLQLTRLIDERHDICITPDGPRGPRYRLHPGALLLAQRARVPLMPLLVEYSAYWRLKSWDGFAIPKPLARVTVTVLPFITVPPDLSDEGFEQLRAATEQAMVERMKMR